MLTHIQSKKDIIFVEDNLTAQEIWERKFESYEGVKRVTNDDFALLKKRLANCEEIDSYLSSPVYYLYTGRNGLWLYERDNAFVFICWHPNVPEQILIFPQLGYRDVDLVSELLKFIPTSPGGIFIARARPSEKIAHYSFSTSTRNIILQTQEEQVLDWRYPVHILPTAQVAALAGGKYMYIRNRIKQVNKRSVNICPFNGIMHGRALENLLYRWAKHNAPNHEEYNLLYAPYENLFSWGADPKFGLSGVMIFVDDQLQAVGLWDVSNSYRETANLFVNFCNVSIAGLSDFLMVKCCEALHDQGIQYLNLGGSELEGLDRFKRKFHPTISVNLCSVAVTIESSMLEIAESEPIIEEQAIV